MPFRDLWWNKKCYKGTLRQQCYAQSAGVLGYILKCSQSLQERHLRRERLCRLTLADFPWTTAQYRRGTCNPKVHLREMWKGMLKLSAGGSGWIHLQSAPLFVALNVSNVNASFVNKYGGFACAHRGLSFLQHDICIPIYIVRDCTRGTTDHMAPPLLLAGSTYLVRLGLLHHLDVMNASSSVLC